MNYREEIETALNRDGKQFRRSCAIWTLSAKSSWEKPGAEAHQSDRCLVPCR